MSALSVRVLFFAACREKARVAEKTYSLPAGATLDALRLAIEADFPSMRTLMPHVRFALNESFASLDTMISPGAVVALIPPVAGGAPQTFARVTDAPLVLDEVVRQVSTPEHGGLVTFSGIVRHQTKGRRVLRLEYEAFVSMAEKTLIEIGESLRVQTPGLRIAVMHRVGVLEPGACAVVIAVSAPHRAEAFRGCEAMIERLKQDVPIWKKEHFEDGEVWVGLGP